MKKLSAFDLGMIIAFVVVGLLGAGAWWYLSGVLSDAQAAASTASSNVHKFASQGFYPSSGNKAILTANNELIAAQLDPVVKSQLQSPDNKLASIKNSNPVDWKHNLDQQKADLNTQAKLHGVAVPNNFYYGFSRYQGQQPTDEATTILSKQLLGAEQIATVLINAPVKSILALRRTYSEDPPSSTPSTDRETPDLLPGREMEAPGGVYTSYPFEVDFEVSPESLHKVIDDLMQSPYVFVIRSVTIQNSKPTSPKVDELDKIANAANPAPSILDIPGATAATKSTVGPQFLFGSESLRVHLRLDMIEWHGLASDAAAPAGGRRNRGRNQ